MTPADLWIEAGRLAIVLAGFALLAAVIWIIEPRIRAIFGATTMSRYGDPFNFPRIATDADRVAAIAEIDASRKRNEITAHEAKRQRRFVEVAFNAYATSAAKSAFMGGRSAS